MKNKIILSVTTIAIIAIGFIVYSCSKTKNYTMEEGETPPQMTIQQKTDSITKIQGGSICSCNTAVPNGVCPQFKSCAKKILGNATTRNFTIVWTFCDGCGFPPIPNSTGWVCYTTSCNELQLQLNDLPKCLQECYGDRICLKITSIVCNNSSFSMIFQGDNGNQTVTITGDPDITVECVKAPSIFKCTGKLNWT